MALHEEQERRALAGELWLLEEAWKEAEEIAAISTTSCRTGQKHSSSGTGCRARPRQAGPEATGHSSAPRTASCWSGSPRRRGLSRTEIFRRGLYRMADEMLADRRPGSSLDHLASLAEEADGPADLAERHDHYLYGGGYRAGATTDDAGPD